MKRDTYIRESIVEAKWMIATNVRQHTKEKVRGECDGVLIGILRILWINNNICLHA